MKQFYRVNIYEIQGILYWILGVLIIHLGSWHWLGWVSIIWGWITQFSIFIITIRHLKEIKDYLDN